MISIKKYVFKAALMVGKAITVQNASKCLVANMEDVKTTPIHANVIKVGKAIFATNQCAGVLIRGHP